MKMIRFSSRALNIGLAAALLTGCGGTQAGGPMPVGYTAAQVWRQTHSWMLPEAKKNDLLYLSNGDGNVYVYSYPQFRQMGKLSGLGDLVTQGLCVDNTGDVYVPTWNFSPIIGYVYEFAHGGTEPIKVLMSGAVNASCAVDSATGNLAVADYQAVFIFRNATGTPTTYTVPNLEPQWLAYDNDSNLFVDGYNTGSSGGDLDELSRGSASFTPVTVNQSFGMFSLQWNNGVLNIVSADGATRDAEYVYRVSVEDGSGTVVGKTTLDTNHTEYGSNGQVWIQGDKIMGAGRDHDILYVWRYPSGGHHIKGVAKRVSPWGVVVSVAPSH